MRDNLTCFFMNESCSSAVTNYETYGMTSNKELVSEWVFNQLKPTIHQERYCISILGTREEAVVKMIFRIATLSANQFHRSASIWWHVSISNRSIGYWYLILQKTYLEQFPHCHEYKYGFKIWSKFKSYRTHSPNTHLKADINPIFSIMHITFN